MAACVCVCACVRACVRLQRVFVWAGAGAGAGADALSRIEATFLTASSAALLTAASKAPLSFATSRGVSLPSRNCLRHPHTQHAHEPTQTCADVRAAQILVLGVDIGAALDQLCRDHRVPFPADFRSGEMERRVAAHAATQGNSRAVRKYASTVPRRGSARFIQRECTHARHTCKRIERAQRCRRLTRNCELAPTKHFYGSKASKTTRSRPAFRWTPTRLWPHQKQGI